MEAQAVVNGDRQRTLTVRRKTGIIERGVLRRGHDACKDLFRPKAVVAGDRECKAAVYANSCLTRLLHRLLSLSWGRVRRSVFTYDLLFHGASRELHYLFTLKSCVPHGFSFGSLHYIFNSWHTTSKHHAGLELRGQTSKSLHSRPHVPRWCGAMRS